MRRALACLLILAAVSGSAVAQTAKPTRVIPSTSSSAAAPTDTAALPPPLVPLTGPSQPVDTEQCRATCARTYYFCLAAGDDDACPTQWTQCRSRCTATYSPRPLGN